MKDIYIGRYAPTPETRDMKIYRFGDLKHYLWKVREIQFWMPVHTPECKLNCTIRVENRPIKIIYVHCILPRIMTFSYYDAGVNRLFAPS
jgi:hypothetical protein